MNNKKIYDIKLIKSKINATFQLLEELEQLAEDLNISDNYLMETMDTLENYYWEIEDIYEELKQD